MNANENEKVGRIVRADQTSDPTAERPFIVHAGCDEWFVGDTSYPFEVFRWYEDEVAAGRIPEGVDVHSAFFAKNEFDVIKPVVIAITHRRIRGVVSKPTYAAVTIGLKDLRVERNICSIYTKEVGPSNAEKTYIRLNAPMGDEWFMISEFKPVRHEIPEYASPKHGRYLSQILNAKNGQKVKSILENPELALSEDEKAQLLRLTKFIRVLAGYYSTKSETTYEEFLSVDAIGMTLGSLLYEPSMHEQPTRLAVFVHVFNAVVKMSDHPELTSA